MGGCQGIPSHLSNLVGRSWRVKSWTAMSISTTWSLPKILDYDLASEEQDYREILDDLIERYKTEARPNTIHRPAGHPRSSPVGSPSPRRYRPASK